MLLALVILVALQAGGLPDVTNFKPVLTKELEFRIDDYKTGFVGRVVVYQNPDDSNEFVRVYYRQVALVSERAKETSSPEGGGRRWNLSNLSYHQQSEVDALGRVQKEADAFAYVQWRTEKDPRTGQDIRTGLLKTWLLEQNGNWIFSSAYGLSVTPLSEPSKANPDKSVIVGLKFELVGGTHIVRVDQDDITAAKAPKEADNEKK